MPDLSNGYEEFASEFIKARSRNIGVSLVTEWTKKLPPNATVIDIGCGNGIPITNTLIDIGTGNGINVFAIDASPFMVQAFSKQFPTIKAKCESVQQSDFFNERYDGVVAIGIMFLLSEPEQLTLIKKISTIIKKGGNFLFSAPTEKGNWKDVITGRESISLGKQAYTKALENAGFQLLGTMADEGGGNYYNAHKY